MLTGSISLPDELLKYYTDLHQELGVGAYARVILALHNATGFKVAIKIVNKETVSMEGCNKIATEIEIIRKLNHQNICKLYQVYENQNFVYMILEYVSGGELYDQIVHSKRLSEKEARRIFRQVLSAVGYLHANGIAHRDLKPENILLDECKNVRIIDFGLSANPSGGLICPLNTLCGSIAYAAPEILARQQYLGNEVDIWSMGVLLFTLLTGYLPFDNHTNIKTALVCIKKGICEFPPWVSKDAKNLILLMLEPDPKKRQTVWNLANHEWVTRGYGSSVSWGILSEKSSFSSPYIKVLAKKYQKPEIEIRSMIKDNTLNEITAHYFYLKEQNKCHVFSLPDDLISPMSFDSDGKSENQGLIDHSSIPHSPKSNAYDTDQENKENNVRNSKSLKRITKNKLPDEKKPSSSSETSTHKPKDKFTTNSKQKNTLIKKIAEIFSSKKNYNQTNSPRVVKPAANIQTIRNCEDAKLKTTLENILLEFKADGTLFSIKFENFIYKCEKIYESKHKIVFTLEICKIGSSEGYETGIMTKRIKGDSWEYKNITEQILNKLFENLVVK